MGWDPNQYTEKIKEKYYFISDLALQEKKQTSREQQ